MKIMHVVATAALATCAAAVVGVGPAQADPTGCTTSNQITQASGTCSGGDGQFQVKANCFGLFSNTYYGGVPAIGNYSQLSNYTEVGQTATVSCSQFPLPFGVATGAQIDCWRLTDAALPNVYVPTPCQP